MVVTTTHPPPFWLNICNIKGLFFAILGRLVNSPPRLGEKGTMITTPSPLKIVWQTETGDE